MSILWCGGEDIDFLQLTGCTIESSYFRSGYGRSAIALSTSAAAKSTVFPGGEITSGWLSCRVRLIAATGTNKHMIGFGKSGTVLSGIFIGTGASGDKIAVNKYNSSTLTNLASEAGNSFLSGSNNYKLDLHLSNYGASSVINLYFNGSLVASFSGDSSISGISGFDSIFLGPTNYCRISEIIVSDSDTRNMSLVTHYPNAAGDTLAWTGNYTNIDEVAIDDADLIYDNTDGHQALFGLGNLPAGSFSVLAVKEAVRACKSSDSTPTKLNVGVKSGTTTDVADAKTLATAWATYERYMAVNPVTGIPFTPAEIDALQIALESEA